ncbi:hypothetical protein ACHAXT_006773 [Thalassiosira profunda]
MEMSSLQRRARGGAPSQPSAVGAFESCFSAGLDLTEFGGGNSSNNPAPAVAASADLLRRKAEAASKRREEERAEAAMDRRVAEVVDASKSAGRAEDHLGDSVPRALHPGNAPDDRGNGRDDNFVQFLDGAGRDGFLSGLVSAHRSEGREGSLSHRARALRKNQTQASKRGVVGGVQGKQRPTKKAASAKVAKKTRKSKRR